MTQQESNSAVERRALWLSVWGNVVFATLGFGFAASSESEAILLDGFFSLVAFILSLLTLRVAKLIEEPDSEWFHFGYAAFEPMLNTIKGLLLLGLCGFSLFSAINSLLHGGRSLNPGWALVYSVIAASGAGLLALVQRRAARTTHSPLLEVDAKNWRVDSLLSVGVGIAFLAAFLLRGSEWARFLPYVDPTLVILIVAIIIKDPIKILLESVGELLAISPTEEVQRQVRDEFARLVKDMPVESFNLRMLKAGRTHYLLAHVVIEAESRLDTIQDLDEARRSITEGLKQLHPPWEVDIVFVGDPSLA